MALIYKSIFCIVLSSIGFAKIHYTWTGVNGVVLEDDESKVFFDPYFSRPSLWKIVTNGTFTVNESLIKQRLKQSNAEKLDAIIISHSHFDHALDMHVVQSLTGAKIFGSKTTINLAKSHKVPNDKLYALSDGQIFQVGKFKMTAFFGEHSKLLGFYQYKPDRLLQPLKETPDLGDYHQGQNLVYLIEHPEGNYVFFGSVEVSKNYSERIKDKEIKSAFLCIAGRSSTRDLLAKATQGSKSVEEFVPMHFDDFFSDINQKKTKELLTVDLDEFVFTTTQSGLKTNVPKYFEKN